MAKYRSIVLQVFSFCFIYSLLQEATNSDKARILAHGESLLVSSLLSLHVKFPATALPDFTARH